MFDSKAFITIPDNQLEEIRGGMFAAFQRIGPSAPIPRSGPPFSGREFLGVVAGGAAMGAMAGKMSPIGAASGAVLGATSQGVGYCVRTGVGNVSTPPSPGYNINDPGSIGRYMMMGGRPAPRWA